MLSSGSNDRTSLLSGVRRVVVKIGSSLITSKDHGLNPRRLETYGDEVARLKKDGYEILLVSSGAIVSGLEKLGLRQRPRSLPEKQAAAAVGQSRLMWAYEKGFEVRGLKVAQVLLTRDDLNDRRRFLNSRNTLTTLLGLDVIPIINENDTVAVDEIRFGDNDSLAGLVTHLIDAHLLIILSDVQGLYTEDPRRNPKATVISTVTEVTPEIAALAGTPSGEEGVGGMASKIQAAADVAAYGAPTVIASGQEADILCRILSSEEIGTIVLPQGGRRASRKHWIATTLQSKGRLVLDDGAVEALVQKGKSLLPSGITEVEGRFEVGDAVSCMDTKGRELAKGLANYSAGEVNKIKGIKTSEISKILGYKGYDEVIHRDNLVVL
jgi:glutamate 5-kinase